MGRALIQQSADLYRAVGDRAGLANALLQVASHTPWEEYRRARAMFDEALQIYRERGDQANLIDGLETLDIYELHCGHLAEARAALEEAVALQRGHPDGIPAGTLHDLGALALHEGRYAEAREHLEACLHKSTAAGNPNYWAVSMLGYIALREGDFERARTILLDVQGRFRKGGAIAGVVYVLEGMASLLTQAGEAECAVQLFAWSDTTREATGNPRPPIEQALVDRDLAVIHTRLDAEQFASAWVAGGALTTEEAIALASSELS